MNQKGGVGKTTTAVNLAAGIALAGRSTLIIDLDPQGHASLHLGVDPSAVEASVYDAMLASPTDTSFDAVSLLHQVRPNLWVLPSNTDLAAAESELASVPDRQKRLERIIQSFKGRFEFIILDCPPSLGLLTINGLVAAKEVIIPMQAHFLALQGVSKLLETVNAVSASVNPKLRVTGVVLCMHETASTHSKEVVADLEKFFEEARKTESPWKFARVFKPAVRRNIKLAECPSFGQTIFDYAPTAPGAEDYAALAGSLVREWDAALQRLAPTVEVPRKQIETIA